MSEKVFKTIDEQIEILKKRGLFISDNDPEIREFLYRNNYYRISGYSLTLRDHDSFYENAQFQNIMDIYHFDHELRHLLLQYIEKIEVAVKSVYAYEFAKLYSGTGYLSGQNFTDTAQYLEIIEKGNRQKEKSLAHEAFLQHYVNDRQEDLPIWIFVDLLTISDISLLYKISQPELKKILAEAFQLKTNSGTEILSEYLHGLTILRNFCAHGSRLYNRLFVRKPSLNSKEKKLLIVENGKVDNAHLFGFILVMRRILTAVEFLSLKLSLIRLTEKYPFVSLRYYGFRDDWKDIL